MKQRLLKAITALTLSAVMLLPADTLPVSACAAETCAEEHVCNIDGYHIHDEYGYEIGNSVETKYLEPEQYAAGTVAAPKASKKSGTITCSGNSASIKLTADSGATIYYSLNSGSFKKYSSAIKLTKNSTIIAYAVKNGKESSVATYSYKLKPKVSFSASDSGSAKTVKLSSGTDGVKLYYTTDGSKPTTKSKLYTSSGITLTKSCQLRVLAVKSGWTNASFSKNYTVNSSTGNSGSSTTVDKTDTTKQLGAGSFTTPSTGKATVRYNGSTKTVDAGHSATSYFNQFKAEFSSKQYIAFTIASGAKFNNGDTLTLSDMNGFGKGSGFVSVVGFDLQSNSNTFSNSDAKMFDKVEIKAVDMDYTGAKPSTIYFYVLVHDESGKKTSLEGLAKVNIKDSKHGTSSGSGSGSTTVDKTDTTKQMGEGNFLTPSTSGNANIRYNGKSMATKAEYWSYSDRDTVWVSVSDKISIAFNIMQDQKFNTGDTIKSWKTGSSVTAYAVLFGFEPNSDYINIFTSYKDDVKFFDKVELKAISIDYTGKNPSVLYFYILVHDEKGNKTCIEGITKVVINESNNIALRGSGNTGNSGNTGSSGGSGGTSTNSTDKIVTKGSETRECKACSNGLCWDCDGAGRVYDYVFGYTKCLTCDGTGYCKVCSGTRKITVEVNVINENAVPEGKVFKKCTNCGGSGVCPYCNGGKVYVFKKCFLCSEPGVCKSCNGSGGTLADKPDPNTGGSSSGSGSSGGSSSGNSGGSTIGDLNICFTCGGTGNCHMCHGTDICQTCFGRGGQSYNTWGQGGSGWVNCSACNGSKKCKYCTLGKCKTCGGTGTR